MLTFKKMLHIFTDNAAGTTTTRLYNIVAARLVSGDGYEYNEAPDGCNMFEVDLEPVDSECDKSVSGLTIIVGNSGDWAKVQRDLNPEAEHEVGPGRFELDTVDALIVTVGTGSLLIVTD